MSGWAPHWPAGALLVQGRVWLLGSLSHSGLSVRFAASPAPFLQPCSHYTHIVQCIIGDIIQFLHIYHENIQNPVFCFEEKYTLSLSFVFPACEGTQLCDAATRLYGREDRSPGRLLPGVTVLRPSFLSLLSSHFAFLTSQNLK